MMGKVDCGPGVVGLGLIAARGGSMEGEEGGVGLGAAPPGRDHEMGKGSRSRERGSRFSERD